MRLIDADKLIEELKIKTVSKDAHIISIANEVVNLVHTQPTAFDVEKVVEKTENVLQDLNVIEIMSHFEAETTIQIPLENFLNSLKTEVERIVKNGGI